MGIYMNMAFKIHAWICIMSKEDPTQCTTCGVHIYMSILSIKHLFVKYWQTATACRNQNYVPEIPPLSLERYKTAKEQDSKHIKKISIDDLL